MLPLILLTAVHAQLPPSPPGAILIQPKPVSPKFSEQVQSWGAPMRSTPSFAPKVVTLPGFTITNLAVTGGQVTLQWKDGVPPFQVIGEPTLYGPWNDVGNPTTARSKVFPEDINHFFTVQGSIVMPLVATQTNNLTRLTWEAPDTDMSDSLQAFTLKRSTDGGATFPTTVQVVQPGGTYSVDDTTAIPAGGSLTWELLEQTLNGVVVPYSKPVASNVAPGTALWARGYGGLRGFAATSGLDIGNGIAVDSSGNVIFVGSSDDGEFGNGLGQLNTTAGMGNSGIFLVKHSASNGFIWSKGFGTGVGASQFCSGSASAVAIGGNVIAMVGTASGSGPVDFSATESAPGAAPPPVAGVLGSDFFVATYTDSGPSASFKWARRLGVVGGPDSTATSVAIDGNGDVFVTGVAGGAINYGDQTRTGHMFLLKLRAADGVTIWSKVMGTTLQNSEASNGVAVDSANNIYITGLFNGSIAQPSDFGEGHTLVSAKANGIFPDIFIAKYSGSNGQCLWAFGYGGTGNDSGNCIAIDTRINPLTGQPFNDVVIGGAFVGPASLGGASLDGSGFVAKYTSDGVHKWSQGIGLGFSPVGNIYGVSIDSMGNIITSGVVTPQGTPVIVPDATTVNSIGSPGVVVIKWRPDGNSGHGSGIWIKTFGTHTTNGASTPGASYSYACAVGPDMAPVLTGKYATSSIDGTKLWALSVDTIQVLPGIIPDDLIDTYLVKLSP